jgi:phage/plasmid-like protein (TIGR03299 family)
MAHKVESAAYADEPAWHGLGTVVKGAMSSAEVCALSGTDWTVGIRKAYTRGLGGRFVEMPGRFAVVRETDGAVLGNVGRAYRPIQNADGISFLDHLVATEELGYEAAGSLRGGQTFWALCRVPEDMIIGKRGDVSKRFILFTTTHDGLSAARAIPTSERVVCWNTLQAALWHGEKELTVHIPHTGDINRKIAVARQIMGISVDTFKLYGIAMNQLADTDGLPMIEPLLNALFPQKEDLPGEENTRRQEKVDAIVSLYKSDGEESAWGLLNAVTAWVDHKYVPTATKDGFHRPKIDGQFLSTLAGAGADIKSQAASMLLTTAGIYERMQSDLDALKVRAVSIRQGG